MQLSSIIEAAIQAGATTDVILAIVKSAEAEQQKQLELKREKDAERQRRCRASRMSRDVTVTSCDSHGQAVTGVTPPTPPLDAPFSLSPDPLPLSPLNPPVTPNHQPARAAKPKLRLEDLSVDHVADWLAEKRSQGRYLDHDPAFVLDQFKNYCQSKGKKYADYIAGYRNAFEWDRCQPHARIPGKQGQPIGQSQWLTAAEQIIAEDRATGRWQGR